MLPFAALGGGAAAAVRVMARSDDISAFKPSDFGLQLGDWVFDASGEAGGFGQNGAVRLVDINAGNLNATYNMGAHGAFVAIRGVRSFRAFNGKRGPGHAGFVVATSINAGSLMESAPVTIAGVGVASSARWYSPPSESNVSRNVHLYLYPNAPLYPEGGAVTVTGGGGYTPDWGILEMVA